MPLSEDEQRILHEIEQQFYESDPAFAREVGKATLFRHAGRNLKWAGLGFVAGFLLLILAFASSLVLGFAGFLIMLGSAFFFERNVRKMSKSGWQNRRMHAPNFKEYIGATGKRLRKRFRREE
ncbi:MAG: DUF3040 domain-containing protein [Actinomycetota bacterium]|nr:DUF3040 domain-containing protein [Actinomycetota bacterium]